jgi:hypothetical protein
MIANNAENFLRTIQGIPGRKIVTITHDDSSQEFDIDEAGMVGYALSHKDLLLEILQKGFADTAGVMVRQFIPSSEELVTLPNGRKVNIPWKALYGAFLAEGKVTYLPAEEVEQAMTTDNNSGKTIQMERFTLCRDWHDFTPRPD